MGGRDGRCSTLKKIISGSEEVLTSLKTMIVFHRNLHFKLTTFESGIKWRFSSSTTQPTEQLSQK